MPPCSIAIWDRLFRTPPALWEDPVSTNTSLHLPLHTNTSPWTPFLRSTPTSLRFLLLALPSSVLCFWRPSVNCVKVERSAKVNPGGLAASANVKYMMSLARSSSGVKGHTWTFVAICLLSIGSPLSCPLEWVYLLAEGLFRSESGGCIAALTCFPNRDMSLTVCSEQLQSPLKIISLFSFSVGWSRSPLEGRQKELCIVMFKLHWHVLGKLWQICCIAS